MKDFNHINGRSVEEVVGLLGALDGKAKVIAGGTDLLGVLKDRILPEYPETIINIKTIPDLDRISAEGGYVKIGALARLDDMARSPIIRKKVPVLAEAAVAVATPQIRNIGTIGGNLCQDVRCLYYRYPHQIGGRIICRRKGKGLCFAVKGDNRYSAVMGARRCFAVCPSDMAVALTALDAGIEVAGAGGSKRIPVGDFCTDSGNVLGKGEMMTEIQIPVPRQGAKAVFLKFRLRDAVDFAIVSAAAAMVVEKGICRSARIVLGAVAPTPVRALSAEAFIKGKSITDEIAGRAADLAFEKAKPLSMNAYKIEIGKKLVQQSIMAAAKA